MTTHTVSIHDHQSGQTFCLQVASEQYILMAAEAQKVTLPYSCRNGACTACAVRVLEGKVNQPEAMGLSPELKSQGYALLCVSYPASDLVVETQSEDEVYELQFGRYFGQGKVQAGIPLEGD
jgi:ferredoxin